MSHAGNQKADCATNLSAMAELFQDFSNALIFTACIAGVIFNLEADTPLGVARTSLFAAIPFALWATVGSVYCHRLLNTQFQAKKEERALALIPAKTYPEAFSIPQRLALAGDWYGHVAEVASLYSLVASLFLGRRDSSNVIPRLGLGAIYLGLLVFGAIVSFADFRTCCGVVREHNRNTSSTACCFGRQAEPAPEDVNLNPV
ncbi:MAG: hypothetical protein NTV32_01905 [Gammaproteobacteria bacterium]|nr:hypothetical protein [Gammaproteobacteria bacterium]